MNHDLLGISRLALSEMGIFARIDTSGEEPCLIVDGDVDLSGRRLQELPDLSRVRVMGDFRCSGNQLSSLRGAPRFVGGHFCCENNRLTSLAGGPREVGGSTYCMGNYLVTLEGAPQENGGSFDCSYNLLSSLAGAPPRIGGDFSCEQNQLISLAGGPQEVGGSFNCQNNLLSNLSGAPRRLGRSFLCHRNQIQSLAGMPDEVPLHFIATHNLLSSLSGGPARVGGHFDCGHNQLASLKDGPRSVGGNYSCHNNRLTSLLGIARHIPGKLECPGNRLESMLGVSSVGRDANTPWGSFPRFSALPREAFFDALSIALLRCVITHAGEGMLAETLRGMNDRSGLTILELAAFEGFLPEVLSEVRARGERLAESDMTPVVLGEMIRDGIHGAVLDSTLFRQGAEDVERIWGRIPDAAKTEDMNELFTPICHAATVQRLRRRRGMGRPPGPRLRQG